MLPEVGGQRSENPTSDLATPNLSVPETLDKMIVDHPHRLHEGVADRTADELETAPFTV
jgi:hypothetical protein